MRNLNDVIESTKNDTSTIGTKAPKIRNLSDVSKTSYFNIDDFKDEITKIAPAPDVESNLDVRLREGIDRGVQSVKNLPEHLQIFQGQTTMALGGLAGSEENVEIGRELIKSAFGEIQADEKKFYENSIPLSEKDYDSFGYALGNGVANYGSMLAIGYLTGGVGGLAMGGALETGSKAREKIEYHIEKTGDNALDQYTSTQAGKDALFTAVYSAGSTIIEKKFGYGTQRKLFKMPVGQHLKNIYKSALSEGGTETAQELYAVGLDLLGGYIDYSKLPERFLGAVQEGVIGSVLGGTAGVGTAMAHRSQAKSILREELKNTVPAKDLENVVNSVYEEVSDTMAKVVATELVQSESLRNKHGAIYESLKTEIRKQITDSGAYTDVDEFTLSQYVESTAKDFADQVLGEANKRKVTIDDVLKASDITYRDGRLYLQGKTEKPKATRKPRQYNPERMELLTYLKYTGGIKDVGGDLRSMDAGRQMIGLINNKSGRSLDDAMLDAWESGYFPEFVERPTVDDLLEAVRASLSGKKRYRESFRPVVEAREAEAKGLLAEAENENLFDNLLSARFSYDELKDMPIDTKEKLYVEMVEQINAISDEDYIQQEINSLTDAEAERYAIMTENGATHDEAMQAIINNRTPEEDLYFQFAGTKAKTANLEKLNIAKQLELEGVSGEDIRKQTGWFKGVDGKWRFEISDKDAEVVLLDEFKQTLKRNIDRAWDEKDKKSLQEKLSNLNGETIYKTMSEQDVRYSYYLGDILKHDKLYQAYPFLRNIMVRFSKMHENLGASVSYYDNNAMSGLIEVNLTSKHYKYSDLKTVLMHEVQHIIQREEKFARGGSQEEYDDYVKYVKSEYNRFRTGLFMSFIKDEFGVDIAYTHAIKIMDDIFKGDRENKKYIYEENKIDRSELIKAVNKKINELSQKEQGYIDKTYKKMPKNSYEFYLRLAGELEARITEERTDLTDEQRLIEPIEEKRNKIKNADAIVVFDDGGTYAYNSESISSGEYYQKSKKQKKIKGAFDKLTKSIKITSEADYSTYKHEFAHFWLDNIWNYANSGQASENYLKQFNELKQWLGTKGNYPTPNQHEKFARAYEKYIYNGTYDKSPIGDVFGEYENFIREVYSDISEIDTRAGVEYKPIPRVVYNFFDSMVTGKLPGVIIDDEPKKEVEKDEKEVKEFIKEETKVLEENRANYTLKPVQTDTKTGYLTAYEKMTGEQVEAGSMELKDQMEKAENFVANNLEQAERIVNGLEQAPEGIVKNAVYVAYNNLQKKLGNTDKRANSMLNQALELRRMGQEIASQRLAYADVEGEASATFWIKEVIKNKAEALADANGLTVTELSDKIDNAISDGIANNKKPEDIVKQLGEELGVTEFYQTEVLSGFGDVDTYAHSYIKRYVNERLGLGMSKTEAETIIRKADDMLASLQNSKSETGNPSVDYFVKLKDMENYANSLAPSSEMRVAMSVIGRGNLLASIKSPVTNIVSNGFVGAFRGAVRRINLGVANSIVSPELIKQNKAYSWEIFKKTGYNVNNITKDTPRNTILGEKLTHSEGEGFIRKLGRIYENTVYKWGLGAGDVLFKDYAFTDYVALKATKLANGNVNKANEIFKDACLIEPKTKEGAEIRQEAIQESLIATYQNDSAISEGALKVRKTMDFGVGFGEFIAPFVKTPANVVSMGLKSSFGGVKAIVSEIQRDLKAGKIQPMTKENIDLLVQNGLGILVASLLMSAIDDDDYMPPYALASSKDKQLAKELNIPYNAIRIGNTWVSLDYLGVLASPLVGLLQARREDGVINSIFGYAKSGGIQALSIPAFGNVADLFENIKNTVRKDGVDALADAGGEVLEQAYARAVPSIISDVAKALDPYDRETKGNEIITKIPFARETADKRVSATTGRAEKLGNPVYDILFGARVKEQVSNSVADELLRLNNVGYGVSLTTVTRSGLLSELDEETKQKVREDFATDYSKELARLIKSSRYSKADDEEKQEMINKIRRDIISKLKRRYLKNRK